MIQMHSFDGCPRLNRTQRRGAIRGGLITARSKRTRRAAWGSGHGNFRTRAARARAALSLRAGEGT